MVGLTGWYDLVPGARATLAWAGDHHEVSWRHGRLVLHAHDVRREAVLAALGGERCVCLDVHDLWEGGAAAWEEVRTLVVSPAARQPTTALLDARRRNAATLAGVRSGSRYLPTVPLAAPVPASGGRAGRSAYRRSPVSTAALTRATVDTRAAYQRTLLRCLPRPLVLRLAYGMAVRRSRQPVARSSAQGRRLDDAALAWVAAPAVLAALHAAGAATPPAALRRGCRTIWPPDRPAVTGEATHDGGEVMLRLPMRWLADVWAPGFAQMGEWFTTRVVERRSRVDVRVEAVRWQPQGREWRVVADELRLARGPDGSWRAAPR